MISFGTKHCLLGFGDSRSSPLLFLENFVKRYLINKNINFLNLIISHLTYFVTGHILKIIPFQENTEF